MHKGVRSRRSTDRKTIIEDMERSEPGDPGQAGVPPQDGGKFEPTTTAKPAPEAKKSKKKAKHKK